MSSREFTTDQHLANQPNYVPLWTYTAHEAQLDVGAKTLKGTAHELNEDQFLVARMRSPLVVSMTSVPQVMRNATGSTDGVTVLAVADGITGEGGGATASAAAMEALVNVLAEGWPHAHQAATVAATRQPAASIPKLREELTKAFEAGDINIRKAAAMGGRTPRMGTTLTVAWLCPPVGYIAHIGDSRCYLTRAGVLYQLTSDHTVGQALSDLGERLDPDSRMHNILSRALGGDELSDHNPDIQRITVMPGDALLLASDGVAGEVAPDRLRTTLTSTSSAQAIASSLVDLAQRAAGRDDMTAVVARLP